ncbi:hypothetical protein OG21DRAFT_1499283 [Imleria badia]|nr:hypothetical protein OG21DRAFT_1499283 [Imleria badia]
MLIYTSKSLLLSDLQGLFDARRIMCLFDPQGHTIHKGKPNLYWDGGETAITHFFKQHRPSCDSNWVCNALNLATLEVEVMQSAVPTKPLRHGFTPERD